MGREITLCAEGLRPGQVQGLFPHVQVGLVELFPGITDSDTVLGRDSAPGGACTGGPCLGRPRTAPPAARHWVPHAWAQATRAVGSPWPGRVAPPGAAGALPRASHTANCSSISVVVCLCHRACSSGHSDPGCHKLSRLQFRPPVLPPRQRPLLGLLRGAILTHPTRQLSLGLDGRLSRRASRHRVERRMENLMGGHDDRPRPLRPPRSCSAPGHWRPAPRPAPPRPPPP